MSAAIDLKNVGKKFGSQTALTDVNLSLPAGHFYALMGRNGAGKSTLMRILMRQETLSHGKAAIFGRDVETDPSDFNQDIGFVSEAIDFQFPVSLETFFRFFSKGFPRWDGGIFNAILGRMGVDPKRYFKTLSRGQRMHVATAAAIAVRPRLLILDEVTSVLDPDARGFFMDHLSEFVAKGGTVLMASNILSEVHNHADHLVLLHEGTVKLNLSAKELEKEFAKLRKPAGNAHAIFSDPDCAEVGLNSDGSTSHLVPVSKAAGLPTELRDQRKITAEEIFVCLTRSRWK